MSDGTPWGERCVGWGGAGKKTAYAAEVDSPRIQALRAGFTDWAPGVDPRRLVFLDEAGTRSAATRSFGRAPVGEPATEAVKHNRGYPVTMIGALTLDGLQALMTIEGGTSGDVFVAWLEHFLMPVLPENALVVMDNLGAHKDRRVAELLATVGAKPVYLPPYSPDLNPIELACSKLKHWIKTARPVCHDTIDAAIAWSLDLITEADAAAWFRHCGWRTV